MAPLRSGVGYLVLALISGCGGRVIDDSGNGDSAPSAPSGNAAGQAGKSDPGTSTAFPSTTLGECKPGFDRLANPGRPCRWITEFGMCFDDSAAACNCVCPTDRNSVCAHGFDDGPNSATLVRCN